MRSPAVKLEGSEVRGTLVEDVQVYWGIPFASPPTGARRLQAPEPATLPAVVDATRPRASAPQPVSKIGARLGLVSSNQDEDCLHLNVWTNAPPGAGRPVIVWIHGGSFDAGNATTSVTHAHHLVARTGAVVVGIQYRLGAIGFLSVPECPDNRGLLDQLEALRFVRRHIAEFGGDPENVTLVGWSAGGISALLLAVRPESKGLFRRVISQSGHVECLHPRRAARRIREALFVALGWPAELDGVDARRRLAEVSVAQLVSAQDEAERRVAGSIHGLPFLPTVGDIQPLDRFAGGAAKGIDLMIGCTREEYKLSRVLELGKTIDEAELRNRVKLLISSARAHEAIGRIVIDSYRSHPQFAKAPASEVWAALASDYYFRYPAWRVASNAARHSNVYAFDVAFRSKILGGLLGASHGIEIPLVFGTYDDPVMTMLIGERTVAPKLSLEVQDAWGAFARNGVPVLPDGTPWARLEASRRAVNVIDEAWAVVDDGFGFQRATWGPHWPSLSAPGMGSNTFSTLGMR